MSDYQIFLTTAFLKKLARIPQTDHGFISAKLEKIVYSQLRKMPHGGQNIKKLRNFDPPTWRYRIGKYRVFYEISDDRKIVSLTNIEMRKNAY